MACTNLFSECNFLSCVWSAPRTLSGRLASTPRPECRSHVKKRKKTILAERSIFQGESCSFLMSQDSIKDRCRSMTMWRSQDSDESQSPYTTISLADLWEVLRPTISYLSSVQLGIVRDALKLAFEAHKGQQRKSGEDFIVHPVEVARILGELELDWETIVAALLHDTVEDTNVVTFGRIEEQFGPVVRRIVEGETKVSKLGKLQCASLEAVSCDVKADDLRQMFLAMTEEVRVIIVKLADRLHNMRTLMHLPLDKQHYIALETLRIFAPLARLLGMYKIKSELEDLSFMYSHPKDHTDLKRRVSDIYKEHEEEAFEARKFLIQRISNDPFFSSVALDVRVHALCKELYSIYKKLSVSNGSIDEIQDISQLRIIVKVKPQSIAGALCNSHQICYHVLGLVHQMWTPVPQSMKDYIANPKPNGYQSLHTKVLPFLYENTFPLEIQIRTDEMDVLAERGIAVHYNGTVDCHVLPCFTKGNRNILSNADLHRRVSWLNAIREWQEEFVGNMTAREFVDTVMGDLLGSRVFVFTPKGEIKNLPKGATVIDYAYQICTELGNKMVAAKVNGNLVSPAHTLANADVIEVITYDGLSAKSLFQRHQQWLQFAKTRIARHKITKFLKEQAALSTQEITTDAINDFISGYSEAGGEIKNDSLARFPDFEFSYSLVPPNASRVKHIMASTSPSLSAASLSSATRTKTMESYQGTPCLINGKHSKKAEKMAVKLDQNQNLLTVAASKNYARPVLLNLQEDVIPWLESWQSRRVNSWRTKKEKHIQWLSVHCKDRKIGIFLV
eukprot:c29195_g2_i1 orf=590-2959(-)